LQRITLRQSVLAFSLAGLPSLAVAAGGLGAILKGSPLEHFSEKDYAHFFASARQAADGPLGTDVDWSVGEGGAHGTVRAVAGFERGGSRCRELQGQVTKGARSDPFRITYCRSGDGPWRLATNRPNRKSVPPAPSRAAAR